MLDLGWTEILIVGVVALIVIGPRDLPVALHTFGKYVAKLKSMAREFQSGIDDIARQHELKELQEGINKFKSPEQAIENYVSGLENQGVKPKAEEPELVEPESENSIAGDNPGRLEDWNTAAEASASPVAMSVADAPATASDGHEPELALDVTPPLEEEPELPLGRASSVASTVDAEAPEVAVEVKAETVAAKTPEPKPGQTAAS